MTSAPLLVLIGPAAAGKTTVGSLAAGILRVPFADLDAVADTYYAEVGWSIERLAKRIDRIGRVAAEREWEPARAHAVQRAVVEHPGAVLALGAGHTSYTDPVSFAAVRGALTGVPHVILLRPSNDRDIALNVLRQRSLASKGTEWISGGHDFLAEWLDDTGTQSLATETVTTACLQANEVAAQIAAGVLACGRPSS